jgi:hypothetical protein
MDETEQSPVETSAPRGALASIGVIALLIVGGLWLMHVLSGAATVQDCVSSGRTNCAPIATTSR